MYDIALCSTDKATKKKKKKSFPSSLLYAGEDLYKLAYILNLSI